MRRNRFPGIQGVVCTLGGRLERQDKNQTVKRGELSTEENVCSIGPGHGLPQKYLKDILGRKTLRDVERGMLLRCKLVP